MAYEQPPRAPIRREKSGSFDVEDGYERKIASFREASREEARKFHRMNQEASRVQAYLAAIGGEGYWPPGFKRWRSQFVDNRLAKTRQDHLAQLTDMRPVIDVSTSQEPYKQAAKVIAEMIRLRWPRMDADLKLVRVADIADAYGTGFCRIGAASPGPMSLLPCGPDQVMPIQPGFDLQESAAVLFKTWKSVWWIKQKFPFTSNGVERDVTFETIYGSGGANSADQSFNRPQHIPEITWNGLSQAAKRLLGKGAAPVPGASVGQYYKTLEVEELFVDDPTVNESTSEVVVSDPFLPFDAYNWWYKVRPGQRLFPRKRHLVFAGSKLLSDGPSPYWHGLYPFAMLQFNPVFWSFWGLSKYRDLLPVNQAINEIVAGTLDTVKKALNPIAITKEGAVGMAAWKEFYPDLPGMKLRVGANESLTNALRFIDPPQLPGYIFQALQWLSTEFDRLSGSVDVAGLQKKRQVPSGDSIDTMRDTQNTALRLEERQLEVFLRDAGRQVVSNEIQFTTADYRFQMLGEAGFTKEDFNAELGNMLPEDKNAQPDFHKQFALTISAGSLHSGAKDREKSVAIQLAGKRLLPITTMYERLEIPDPEGTFKRLLQEHALESQAGGSGSKKPVSGKREK